MKFLKQKPFFFFFYSESTMIKTFWLVHTLQSLSDIVIKLCRETQPMSSYLVNQVLSTNADKSTIKTHWKIETVKILNYIHHLIKQSQISIIIPIKQEKNVIEVIFHIHVYTYRRCWNVLNLTKKELNKQKQSSLIIWFDFGK